RERRMQIREWIADAWFDVRQSTRSLSRERAFSAFTIVTLALGIGANTTMFGIIDRLLLKGPEHVREAKRVQQVQMTVRPKGMNVSRSSTFGYVLYDQLRQNANAFEAV